MQDYGVGIFNSILTKSALKKAIKKNLVYIDGKVASTGSFVKENQVIELHEPDKSKVQTILTLDLEVVYEDDHLAVVNKPAGILVSGNKFKTVDRALPQNLFKSNQPDVVRPRPVHRLDYATTGLLLVGKTSSSILALNKLFEDKSISKTYFAIALGKMDTTGTIDIPVEGKESLTHFEVIDTVNSERFKQLHLVRLSPKTGRRHQLRKHLSIIGNPILGDATYGMENLILKGKGLYLHAFSLEFIHPFTHEKLYIEKALPFKFNKIFGTP